MNQKSEAQIERELIQQLHALGYEVVSILDSPSLLHNLKKQLELFNATVFSDKEFEAILNHLSKGGVYEKAKTLRDYFQLSKEDGTSFYVRFFNDKEWNENSYQVTHQISQEGSYKNRYDVTLLVNGLPLVQIELKRKGTEIKEAFNQINRYQKHSFWSNYGLFQYVQLFVISNAVNTKYLANNELQSVKQTFFWSDFNNKNITELTAFTAAFFPPDHLGKMISKYIVINETFKNMMVLRPYQYYATEAIIHQVKNSDDNAYIWHTTGSGKTLTSFKASQLLMDLPHVHKVVFVVDRKDLDYQTMNEFNAFKKDSVDVTDSTKSLVRQLTDDSKLVLTTIQKLNNAISHRHQKSLLHLQDKKMVFIFDECHRSQFGDTHDAIIQFFNKSQLIGFTGTPIFAENASKNHLGKRTTKDLFGNCLHKYVITDAIKDQNVLRFGIEYIGRYKNKSNTFIDIDVEDINKKEVLDSPQRIEKIVDYIIKYHDQKTFNRAYSALFAVSSIDNVIQYYDLFQKKKEAGEHDLRIATIFTFGTNEASSDAQDYLPEEYDELPYNKAAEPEATYQKTDHTRDKLDQYIADYNKMFQVNYSTKDGKEFENYFKNISQRLKEREKKNFNDAKDRLDIVLVVNMMLTGFDAKKVNTLYVDKNLKQHGLIQAYSRTNRIFGEQKSQGNILAFRNLKKATDDAITLFSNKEAIEVVTLPNYDKILEKFNEALQLLREIVPTYHDVDELLSEDDQAKFVIAFRRLLRSMNVLQSFADFDWEDLPIDLDEFKGYETKYLDLKDSVAQNQQKNKVSILNDIDFELELIHRDQINVAYILRLLAGLKEATPSEAEKQRKTITDLLGGEIKLRSKRELIEKFIAENLPNLKEGDEVQDAFEKYWQEQKVLALGKICEEEHLDKTQFKALIDAYIYSGREPIKDEVFQCLDNRPSILQARAIGDRIIAKMKQFVETFEDGMVA